VIFDNCYDKLTRSSATGNETMFTLSVYRGVVFKRSGTKGDDQWETN
jgi:hypothetical protein